MSNKELVKAFLQGITGQSHNSRSYAGIFVNYQTNLAFLSEDILYVNDFRYSNTTTKIQVELIYHAEKLGLKIKKVSPGNLNRIISGKKYSESQEKLERELKEQISSFADEYTRRLKAGDLDFEGRNGDCFNCQFGLSKSPDHLLSHIEEKYYPFSLIRLLDLPPYLKLAIQSKYADTDNKAGFQITKAFKTILIRYLEDQLMRVGYQKSWIG